MRRIKFAQLNESGFKTIATWLMDKKRWPKKDLEGLAYLVLVASHILEEKTDEGPPPKESA